MSRKRVSAPVSRPSLPFDEGPEDVLPAQHPVREEIEARVLLRRDELSEISVGLLVDRLGSRPPTVEVARRLDERLRPRIEPWDKSLQFASFTNETAPAKEIGSGALRAL